MTLFNDISKNTSNNPSMGPTSKYTISHILNDAKKHPITRTIDDPNQEPRQLKNHALNDTSRKNSSRSAPARRVSQ